MSSYGKSVGRTIGNGLAVLVTAALLLPASAWSQDKPYAGQTLRFGTYGGSFGEWVQKNAGPRFEELTGAKIEYVAGTPRQNMTSLVAAKGQTPPLDLISMPEDLAAAAVQQGVIDPSIDPKLVPNVELLATDFRPTAKHGPSDFVAPNGIVYDAEKFAAAGIPVPTSYDSFNDPRLAGHVAIPDISFTFAGMWAAINLMRTGDATNFDGSIAWIQGLQDPIIYRDFATLYTRFMAGEVWAIAGSVGYTVRFGDAGKNLKGLIVPVGDHAGQVMMHTIQVAKGSPNAELAQIFINTFLDTDLQTKLVLDNGFTTSNTAAREKARAANPRLDALVPASLDNFYQADWDAINAAFPEWVEKWNRVITR